MMRGSPIIGATKKSSAVSINRSDYSRDQQDVAFAFSVPVLKKAPLPPPAPLRKPRAASIEPPALTLPGSATGTPPAILLSSSSSRYPSAAISTHAPRPAVDSDDDDFGPTSGPTRRVQISASAPVDSFMNNVFLPSFGAITETDGDTDDVFGSGSSNNLSIPKKRERVEDLPLGKSPTVFSLMKTHVLNGVPENPRLSNRDPDDDEQKSDDDVDVLDPGMDDIGGGVFSMSLESGDDGALAGESTFPDNEVDFYSG